MRDGAKSGAIPETPLYLCELSLPIWPGISWAFWTVFEAPLGGTEMAERVPCEEPCVPLPDVWLEVSVGKVRGGVQAGKGLSRVDG